MRRHHVFRQLCLEAGLERRAQLGFSLGVWKLAGRDHITHQLLAGRAVLGHHHGFPDAVQRQQAGFDFAKLDTEPAYFHLMVNAPDVLDHTLGAIAGQVAGAVQPLATGGKRVRHKAFGGQCRALEIATGQAIATDQ
ncbi:hypothetical protein D3C78_710420 [compost metagenome]